jgi:hypothetical protein
MPMPMQAHIMHVAAVHAPLLHALFVKTHAMPTNAVRPRCTQNTGSKCANAIEF